MGRIQEYSTSLEAQPALDRDDIFLAENDEGTGVIKPTDLLNAIIEQSAPGMRRNYFRGKNLGDHVTEEQIEAIRNGTFTGLIVGDYWEINDYIWRIADFDYWYQTIGPTSILEDRHHAVIIPDQILSYQKLNPNRLPASEGWMGTNPYQFDSIEANVKPQEAFGDYILEIARVVSSGFSTESGVAMGLFTSSRKIDYPDENMLFGHTICAAVTTTRRPVHSSDYKRYQLPGQLALFRLAPRFLKATIDEYVLSPGEEQLDTSYWLKDVADIDSFCLYTQQGMASFDNANNIHGLRPVFAIG